VNTKVLKVRIITGWLLHPDSLDADEHYPAV
jgi:hypothetical protein